jgi:hypothetical protein
MLRNIGLKVLPMPSLVADFLTPGTDGNEPAEDFHCVEGCLQRLRRSPLFFTGHL